MIFDSEKQKQIVLQLINAATFTGKSIDEMYEFKQVVKDGDIGRIKECEDGKRGDPNTPRQDS